MTATDAGARGFPATAGDSGRGERRRARNVIGVAWMRRPLRAAGHKTRVTLCEAYTRNIFWGTLAGALLGLPRALRQRRVISQRVEKMQELLELSKSAAAACDAGHGTV